MMPKDRNRVLERLAAGAPLEEVLSILVATTEEVRPEMLCSVLLLDKETKRLRHGAAPRLPDFYNDAIDGLEIGPGAGSCGAAAYTGERVIVEDVMTHPNWVPYRELAERAELRACWSEPIFSSTDEVLGTLAMYYREPRAPDQSDLVLIETAADLAGIAIERKLMEEALREAQDELEARVEARTRELSVVNSQLLEENTERKRAEEELRKSEVRYRTLFKSAPIAIREEDFSKVKAHIDARNIDKNKDFVAYIDRHPEFVAECAELIIEVDANEESLKLHNIDDKNLFLATFTRNFSDQALRTLKDVLVAIHNGETNLEFETFVVRADGSRRDVTARWAVAPGHEDSYSQILFTSDDVTERKRAEEALRKAHEELEWRVEERTRELRTVNVQLLREIAERKQREEALRVSEARLAEAQRIATIGHWIWDEKEDREVYCSGEGERIFGVPHESLSSNIEEFLAMVHPDDRERVRAVVQKAQEDQTGYAVGYKIIRPDGEMRFIHEVAEVEFDNDGELTRTVGTVQDITERKQAEEALRESEARYQAVVEDQTEMISRHAPDGSRTFVNDAYCRFYGRSRDQLIGRSAYETMAPEDVVRLKALYARLTPDQPFGDFEVSFPGPDGEAIWQHWTKRAIFDASGIVTEYQAVGRDITERKRIEEALRLTETSYREIFEQSPLSIWEEDWSGVKAIVDCLRRRGVKDLRLYLTRRKDVLLKAANAVEVIQINQATVDIYGGTNKAEVMESASGNQLAETELQTFFDQIVLYAGGAVSFADDVIETTIDGREIMTHLRADIPPDHCETWSRVITIVEDITERKQAEEALRESETSLANAQRIAGMGNWEWNVETDEVRRSAEMYRLLGMKPEDLDTSHEAFLKRIHPDDREAVDITIDELRNKREHFSLQFRIVLPDGRVRVVHERGEATLDDAGKPVLVAGTTQDITERMQTQAQLIQASKLATLGEMATGLAHELNQPLNVIRMAADNIIERITDGEIDAQYLLGKFERISAQTERAADIIDHMQIFGRKVDGKPEYVDPREAIKNALGLVEEQLRIQGIKVETDFPDHCRKVLGHSVQLEQVLVDIISNARDAIEANRGSPGDPRNISLIVEDTGLDDKIRLVAKDTGGGIPEHVIDRIFDPFFTTKEVGKGTGLGLSVGYGIVSEMGGTMEAANVEDGAEIIIALPAVEEHDEAV